jgi:hypothetical protein
MALSRRLRAFKPDPNSDCTIKKERHATRKEMRLGGMPRRAAAVGCLLLRPGDAFFDAGGVVDRMREL